MSVIIWTGIGFLAGSLPFSYWIGRLVAGVDLQAVNDGNPGAANVFRVCGWRWGVFAMVLDWAKGFVPVFIPMSLGTITNWEVVPVALAPVLGHGYSPFLRFHGGKGLATSFGIWTALTVIPGPFVLGFLLTFFLFIQQNHGWTVLLTMLAFLIYLLFRGLTGPILTIWIVNFVFLAWKYRPELQQGSKFHWIFTRDGEYNRG